MTHQSYINNIVRKLLIEAGFKGKISLKDANKKIKRVKDALRIGKYRVDIEPCILHHPGGNTLCDCERSVVKVSLT
jgi:hypothetical protein